MNKRIVETWIPFAKKAIESTKIESNGKIEEGYRSQISSFGAAVTMGSMKAAVAFFSDKGGSSVDRTKLMTAILEILKMQASQEAGQSNGPEMQNYKTLAEYVFKANSSDEEKKENVMNAAIAIKLAMNLFVLVKKDDNGGEK